MIKPGSRVAIVGGGVAGIVSAYLLQDLYDVTIFESAARLGGHTNTIYLKDSALAVDTGFIVLNDQNYPLFNKFLNSLNVEIRNSDMSFSYESRDTGFCYAGTTLDGLFAQRINFFNPKFYNFLFEIRRFALEGQKFICNPKPSMTLGEFIKDGKYSNAMRDYYLLPMGAAIWSCPLEQILDFPAQSFLSFFKNHGLLSIKNRPQWQTVVGGSYSYINKFLNSYKGKVELDSKVKSISNQGQITLENGKSDIFEVIVLACHADQALQIISEPSPLEKELLGAWSYEVNKTILHVDRSYLPLNKRAWASWNYIQEGSINAPVSVTYHMNRLQGFKSNQDYCVTLNPGREIDKNKIIEEFIYHHPVFDLKAVNTQASLFKLQGLNRRYFCGSYFGYGFHEDAVSSAVKMSECLGVSF